MERVDLAEVFRELQRKLRSAPPQVAVRWHNELTMPVVTDRRMLTSILQHLIDNAIKFTPAGEIDVRAAPLPSDCFAVRVRDTGIGIAPENIPVIFELFRQIDGSETRHYGGTGVGLHLVMRLVKRLGGSIDVASVPEGGSTFSVTLPSRAVL
jgi:signal transduction histidine kinase